MASFKNITKNVITPLILLFSLYQTCFSYSLHSRIWGGAEYLYWWSENSPISVPLATTNPNSSVLATINTPGTQIIFGAGSSNNIFNFNGISGARITFGGWIDNAYQYGVEGTGFGLAQAKKTFTASSVGGNIANLDVPFFSTQTSSENVLVGGRPNIVTDSDTFQPSSVELNGLFNVSNQVPFPLILSAGFRYLNINEKLTLNDAIYNTPSLPPNSVLNVRDNFSTYNNFYGLQIGARTDFTYANFVFEALTELALGTNYQKLKISGQTNINNTTILQPIGLFAEPTNIGTFKNNVFAIIPELEFKIGYHVNKYIRPFVTYNFIYINKVIRPGKSIDRNINQSQNILLGGSGTLSGPAAPLPGFKNTSIWIQGISAGIEFDLG